jgi:glutaredoxin
MKVEIYSTDNCPKCQTAISLSEGVVDELIILKSGVDFEVPEMIQRIGRRVMSYPQIFLNDEYVGGLEEYQVKLQEINDAPDMDGIDDLELDL